MAIDRSDIDFLNEAKNAFMVNKDWYTYRDCDDSYIALRRGEDIEIFKLDSKVSLFTNQLNAKK